MADVNTFGILRRSQHSFVIPYRHLRRTGAIMQENPELVCFVATCDPWLSAVCQLCQRQLQARTPVRLLVLMLPVKVMQAKHLV